MRSKTISCVGRKWYFRVVSRRPIILEGLKPLSILRLGTIPQVLISSSFRTSRLVDSKHSPPTHWSPPFPRRAYQIESNGIYREPKGSTIPTRRDVRALSLGSASSSPRMRSGSSKSFLRQSSGFYSAPYSEPLCARFSELIGIYPSGTYFRRRPSKLPRRSLPMINKRVLSHPLFAVYEARDTCSLGHLFG